MKTLLSASILVAYAIVIIVLTLGIAKTASSQWYNMNEPSEIRFQSYGSDGFSQGTVRPWGADAYKIQTYGDRGMQETIIRVPDPDPLGVYSEPPITPYQPLPGWE